MAAACGETRVRGHAMIIVSTHLEPQPHTPECSVLPQTIARLLSRRSCERASTLSSQRRGWTDAAQTAYGTMRRGAEQRVAVALLCRADAPAAPNHVARTRLRTLAAADERSATASSSTALGASSTICSHGRVSSFHEFEALEWEMVGDCVTAVRWDLRPALIKTES